MSRHLVIVEDEAAIRDNYTDLFRRQGYRVDGYADRTEAAVAMARGLPDLVILDIGLGDEFDGGYELCRELRTRSSTLPIIFLTARDADIDVVAGLRVGADDYVSKNVSLHQLTARVSALLRRAAAARDQRDTVDHVVDGGLRLEVETMRVSWRGQAVALTVTELWILHALVRHPGHVRSRQQLMEAADIYVDLATISSHIKRIRRKFVAIDPAFDAIEAVYGAGYRWIPQQA